jgi:hypothetical protein
MNRKTTALTLLLITALAVTFAGIATTFAQTNSTATDTTASTSTTIPNLNATDFPFGGMGMMMGDRGFGGGQGGPGGPCGPGGHGRGFGGPMGNIQVSAAFNQTVTNILGNDSDVTNLISQGYNVTSIRPQIQCNIGTDGSVTTNATAAIVTMQKGTSGQATITVDITNAKVTQIVILTRTVIDKTTS